MYTKHDEIIYDIIIFNIPTVARLYCTYLSGSIWEYDVFMTCDSTDYFLFSSLLEPHIHLCNINDFQRLLLARCPNNGHHGHST